MTEYQIALLNIVATMLALSVTTGCIGAIIFLYVLIRDFVCEELL